MADHDRLIPPGGEGTIKLQLNLAGYDGRVRKSATVYSNDSNQAQLSLTMQGQVQTAIMVSPRPAVFFQGAREQLPPQTLDITAGRDPFQVLKVTNQLADQIDYQLNTLEPGRHYQLVVTNKAASGDYQGVLICTTDHPQKPQLTIRVTGRIEGRVSVRPKQLLIGKLNQAQGVKIATVVVMNNGQEAIKITKLDFDSNLLQVEPEQFESHRGYTLRLTPKLESLANGEQRKTELKIETDIDPGHAYPVQVFVVNR
ncbi:MAG: hypothetical protein AUK55_01505 [Syntrophobacteraceae bacterium CG2_30_61_12]|nr:MAG: hypothetical protein AUK55_01505 [Syntrophobacteraceae bacterium CG2_30_61_12]